MGAGAGGDVRAHRPHARRDSRRLACSRERSGAVALREAARHVHVHGAERGSGRAPEGRVWRVYPAFGPHVRRRLERGQRGRGGRRGRQGDEGLKGRASGALSLANLQTPLVCRFDPRMPAALSHPPLKTACRRRIHPPCLRRCRPPPRRTRRSPKGWRPASSTGQRGASGAPSSRWKRRCFVSSWQVEKRGRTGLGPDRIQPPNDTLVPLADAIGRFQVLSCVRMQPASNCGSVKLSEADDTHDGSTRRKHTVLQVLP
ncbi:hypothetical protein PUN4_370077 [Paraburkholderia unamae]|nr:hypothetical protein PUN4_370077 [Paraburkholderia unamae]